MYSDLFETSYKQSNENLVGWKARIDEAIGTRNAGKMARQVVLADSAESAGCVGLQATFPPSRPLAH